MGILYQLHVFLSEPEQRRLQENAAASGLSRSEYIRRLIMGQEIRPRPPDEYAALLRELSAIGNNINQLAHTANITHEVTPEQLTQARELAGAAWRLLKERM